MMKRILIILAITFSAALTSEAAEKGYEKRIEGYAFAGLTDQFKSIFGISMINGWRITPGSYLGVGTGFEYSNCWYISRMKGNQYAPQYMIPVFGEYKFNFRNGKNPSPYLLFDAGWVFNASGKDEEDIETKALYGLMASTRFGIDVKINDGISIFGAVGPRLQHTRRTNKFPLYGEWEYEYIHNYVTCICIHIDIIF